jgi:hypothetical protein
MAKRSEAGAAARWERQQTARRKKGGKKKVDSNLDRDVRSVVEPDDNPEPSFPRIFESLSGTFQRVSEAIQDFSQSPAFQRAAEAMINSRPLIPLEPRFDESGNLSFFTNQLGEDYSDRQLRLAGRRIRSSQEVGGVSMRFETLPQLQALYRSAVQNPALDFIPGVYQGCSCVMCRSRRNEHEAARQRQLELGAVENQPQPSDSSLWATGPVFQNFFQSFSPKPEPLEIDQARAKVARASKLLADTSQLLSRVIAGLEVTPDEAQALKARIDAGVEAFK